MPKSKSDSDQASRFIAAAKKAGADETGNAFERAFAKIVPPKLRPADTRAPKKARTK